MGDDCRRDSYGIQLLGSCYSGVVSKGRRAVVPAMSAMLKSGRMRLALALGAGA